MATAYNARNGNGASTSASVSMKSAGAGTRGSWCMTSARATVVEDFTPSPRDIAAQQAAASSSGNGDDDDGGGLLTLRAGQQVTVVAQSDDGWWAGALDGRLGRFPARCVRLLHSPRSAGPSPPASLSASSGGVAVPPRPSPRGTSAYGAASAVVLQPPPALTAPPSRPTPPPPSTSSSSSSSCSSSTSSTSPRSLPKPPSPRSAAPSPGHLPKPPSPRSAPGSPAPAKPPPAVPSPSSSDGTDKESRMRREVINEIIRTEQDYIHDLEVVIRLFMTPLRMSNILNDADINTIFSNMQLLLGVNMEFNQNLSKKVSELSTPSANIPIGDVFAKLADYFKMYTIYCSNHPTAVDTKIKLAKKNSNFRKFLALAEGDAACRGLNLNDYLIKPVQRICKYPLFLRELVKYTPETHEDYSQLTLAERKIGEVVTYINQGARQAAARDQVVKIHSYFEAIELLSPTRRLVREGLMTWVKGKEKNPVWVWLFNDLVLLGKPKQSKYLEESKRKTHCFTVVAKVGLGEVRLVNLSTVEGVEAFEVQMVEKEGMKVTKVKESFVLGLPTVEQKTEWMFGLKNIIKHFQQIEFVAEKKKAETEAKLEHDGKSSPATSRGLAREMSVFDLVKQTGSSAEDEGKLATIDVYFGGVGLIANGRRLVRDTQMAWLSGKNKDKSVDVWVWLFNDLFLIGKPKKQKHLQESHRTASCFSTVAKVGLDELRLINLSSLQGYEAFEVEHVEKDGMTVVKVKDSYTLGMGSTEAKMEWVLSVNKLVKEFMQKDLLHEKRKRVNEGEASPLSPRRSGSIIQRPASFYAPGNAASPTSSPRGSDIMRSRADSQMTLEDSELVAIDSLFGGVALVAPGRQLVREGPVTWLNSKNKDKVWMWLLTDVILIGKPKKPKYMRKDTRKPSCFNLLANIGLDEMKLVNMGTVEGLEAFEIQDVEKEGVLAVRVRERFALGAIAADARDWVTAIKNSLKHFQLQEVSAEKARMELAKEGVEAEIERKKGGSFIIRQRQRKDSLTNIQSEEKKGFFGWKRSISSPRLVAPPSPSLAAIPSPASASGLSRSSISREDFQAISDDDDDFGVESEDVPGRAPYQQEAEEAERPLPPTPAVVPPRPRNVAPVSSMSMPDLPRVEEIVATPAKKITSSLFLDDFGPRG